MIRKTWIKKAIEWAERNYHGYLITVDEFGVIVSKNDLKMRVIERCDWDNTYFTTACYTPVPEDYEPGDDNESYSCGDENLDYDRLWVD